MPNSSYWDGELGVKDFLSDSAPNPPFTEFPLTEAEPNSKPVIQPWPTEGETEVEKGGGILVLKVNYK